MTDPTAPTLTCQDSANNTTFSGSDDVWGNGNATNRETGCVDALYAAQQMKGMMSSWLGRNGMNGSGGWVPMRVGLNDQNAYYDGTQTQYGKNTAGQWITSIDVVAHEFGHGVDDKTPGGISGGGTQEFIGDALATATEYYDNQGAAYDPPGPHHRRGDQPRRPGPDPRRLQPRQRRRPGLLHQLDPDHGCPRGRRPRRPLVLPAVARWHLALRRHHRQRHRRAGGDQDPLQRDADEDLVVELPQVPHLDPAGRQEPRQHLRPVQRGQERLGRGQRARPVGRPDLRRHHASAAHRWQPAGQPGLRVRRHLVGRHHRSDHHQQPAARPAPAPTRPGSAATARTSTENLTQTVTIPSTATAANLSYWIRTDTAETGSTVYDTMRVQIIVGGVTTTLRTFSNVGTNSTYTQYSHSLLAHKGKAVTVKLLMNEDSSLQTSFVVDDTAVSVS